MSRPTLSQLPYRTRAELFTQLAQLEASGLPFARAIALIEVAGEAAPRLQAMRKRAEKGEPPAQAGEKSGLFTRLEARLIHAAWNAGSPAGMYRRLADLYTARAMQLSTMKSRMALPALVLVMALFIKPLPALAGGAIGAGGYLLGIFKPLLALVLIYFLGRMLWRYLLANASTSTAPTVLTALPLFGNLLVRRNVRDFFESVALMLEAGVSMLDALPMALETIEVGAIRREFAQLRPRIEQGLTLSQALSGLSYLNRLDSAARAVEFAATGEQSGTLPEMLLRHVKMETDTINEFFRQAAQWIPRVVYGAIALWIAYGILTGGAFMPKVPANL
ncbi:MAG: type II secretion system F family protein [Betaproteobacteria bacterium]|nr:type II secretion system F family protein [Betaproteobacteria bacterium]